ncbi:MAG: hypothetical protein Faunusvirus12_17 [Faunusvirus sp.]|uniref:Uncharacterized protein n=1 Tax=Faunusvirus sp. TaxID=2487766 RepID=A0A3G4ZYK9_9VIRU|nr:MAG: hypothetical protein Faunusvirus12_17 [Faunusvirus sp.]
MRRVRQSGLIGKQSYHVLYRNCYTIQISFVQSKKLIIYHFNKQPLIYISYYNYNELST